MRPGESTLFITNRPEADQTSISYAHAAGMGHHEIMNADGSGADTSEPDPLLTELRAQLPTLMSEALKRREINNETSKAPKVLEALLDEWPDHADELLVQTNPEITRLREARENLAQFAAYPVGNALRDRLRGYAGHLIAITLVGSYAIAAWAEWHAAVEAMHTRFALITWVAGGLLATFSAFMIAVRSQRYADDEDIGIISLWTLFGSLAAFSYTSAVAHWWHSTMHAIPHLWAVLLWIAGGLASLVSFIAPWTFMADKQSQKHKLELRFRLFATAFAGAICILVGILWDTKGVAVIWLASCAVAIAVILPQILDFSPLNPVIASSPEHTFRSRRQLRSFLRQTAADAEKEWREAAMERAFLPFLRRRLYEFAQPVFSVKLTVHDAPGLRQMRANQYIVSTRVSGQFKRRLERLDGGAVGIAGPRGAGKTTLLEAERDGLFLQAGQTRLTVMESVPVDFEARDFALHLYARLCTEVINLAGDGGGSARPLLRSAGLRWLILVILQLFIWLAIAYEISSFFKHDPYSDNPGPDLRTWLAGAWWLIIVPLALSFVLAAYARHGPLRNTPQLNAARVRNLSDLGYFARNKLDNIQFQQRNTAGWSGKVGLPLSSQLTSSRSVELTRQAMTHPELVRDFIDFLRATLRVLSATGKYPPVPVVIIIDELDKIASPEKAQEFINEAKALFNIDFSGCLYLISVSEDALASFERRGLPIRDAFDSAFDEVFRIDYLTMKDSYTLLRNRITGLSEPFLCLCHCLAGGLPRELIRVAREVTDPDLGDTTLGMVCHNLVSADLRNKTAALRTVISRDAHFEPWASELIRYLNEYSISGMSADSLIQAAAKPPVKSLQEVSLDDQPVVDLLSAIQFSTITYLYYCATLLEVFTDDLTDEQMSEARDTVGDGSFDALASIRQLFAVSARVAWLSISAFRKAWGLTVLSPPPAKPRVRRATGGTIQPAANMSGDG